MNSNIQTSSIQMNKISQIPSGIHQSQNSGSIPNPHPNISPMNRVAILKTEEQKEIVRTNVFEPNNTSSENDQKFCVVTEVIRRKSNISFDSKSNASNKVDNLLSFNKPISDGSFQNRTLNINIVDSSVNQEKIKNEESYKLLIKRLTSQLKNKIRPPTHGFFFFALLKGTYPLMIIKKLEGNILNHSIELNSDIFQEYTQKYFRYKELVKKIALLLKRNLKNRMFWENERYQKESIQVKVTNKNNSSNNANTKNISYDQNTNKTNIANKKNLNNYTKSNIQNKKPVNNLKNPQTNQNNNQKKIKSHVTKTNNTYNNKSNISHSSNQNNFGSHRFNINNSSINSFNAVKTQTQIQNQNQKKGNTKKTEPINANKNLFNKSLRNKNVNNNDKNETTRSASSETNKAGKIKFMNMAKIPNMVNKDNNTIKEEAKNKSEKTQIITISKKSVNNNMPNIQNISSTDNDIEMKDESNIIKQEIITNNNEQKKQINMKMIPHRNTTSNTTMNNSSLFNIPAPNNSSIIRQNNVQKITFDSIKSPGKKLHIKLSPLKKTEDVIKQSIKQNKSKNKDQIPKKEIKIDINEIIIPSFDNNKITDDHISFVNKFNVLISNNDIVIEYNIPMSKSEEGINCLKKNEFWEKYIYYLYINYLIDNKNKISLFTFIHLIEQYFLWCDLYDSDSAKKFKKLIIDIIKKVFSEKDINQFLVMNKMNNLEELFAKYEIFMKYGNKINYKTNKEIEIKIDNDEECNCELCKNEKACVKKISEMNKKSNINMSIESIHLQAEYSPKAKKKDFSNNQLETNNYFISLAGKDKSGLFSKSKTIHSFESVFQYIPPRKSEDLLDIEEKEKNESSSKRKKTKSNSKSKSKSSSKKKEKEKYIDLTKETKLEEYFDKENEKEKGESVEEENKEDEEISSNNKSRSRKKYSKRNNKKNKKRNNSNKDENEREREEKEKKKDKKKKKQKSKSRNKSYSRKYPLSDSETESDEDDFTKNKNKKVSHNPKRKKGKSKW